MDGWNTKYDRFLLKWLIFRVVCCWFQGMYSMIRSWRRAVLMTHESWKVEVVLGYCWWLIRGPGISKVYCHYIPKSRHNHVCKPGGNCQTLLHLRAIRYFVIVSSTSVCVCARLCSNFLDLTILNPQRQVKTPGVLTSHQSWFVVVVLTSPRSMAGRSEIVILGW